MGAAARRRQSRRRRHRHRHAIGGERARRRLHVSGVGAELRHQSHHPAEPALRRTEGFQAGDAAGVSAVCARHSPESRGKRRKRVHHTRQRQTRLAQFRLDGDRQRLASRGRTLQDHDADQNAAYFLPRHGAGRHRRHGWPGAVHIRHRPGSGPAHAHRQAEGAGRQQRAAQHLATLAANHRRGRRARLQHGLVDRHARAGGRA